MGDTCGGETSAVVLTNIGKRYGEIVALDGVSARLRSGETIAVLGPNGAGKTSLIELLLGLRHPDRGQVRVLGGTPGQAITVGRVGGMLQRGGLPENTKVREILDLAVALYGGVRTRAELLVLADLGDLADRRVQRLFGGEAQRVRFAMAVR